MTKLLKLRASDNEDLEVISTILQDSIVPVVDMAYRPDEKDFVMVVHRYRCEGKEDSSTGCRERIRSAVFVSGVASAQLRGIDRGKGGAMLDLLAVIPEKGSLQFVFAGGGKIRLKLADWMLLLEDFGEPWPASYSPCHDEEGAESKGRRSGKAK